MSWLDDIIDFGSSAVKFVSGNSAGSQLSRLALTGLLVNQVSKTVNRANSGTSSSARSGGAPAVDRGVKVQVNPNTENRIPVVYGSTFLSGMIVDAELTNNNKTMHYVIAISEKTGNVSLGAGAASEFTFEDIYWNDQRLVFQSDGITVNYSVDRDSNIDYSLQNQVQIYCFNNGSESPVVPDNYTNTSLQFAYSIMPSWVGTEAMSDLAFVIVRVDYSKEKNVTQLGNLVFHLTNSLNQPGDCLYDYMTNTRYGAGITSAEIYVS